MTPPGPEWVERAEKIVDKCQGSHSRDIYGENLSSLRKLIALALAAAFEEGRKAVMDKYEIVEINLKAEAGEEKP